MKENLALCLQLFADVADGDTAQFTGENEAAAAPQATGEETASDAGVQDRSSEFEKLIKGQYKQEYDDRVRSTVQKRLKEHKALEQKMQTLAPALEKLASRFGLDPEDAPALARALEQQELSTPHIQAQKQHDQWLAQAEQTKQAYPGFDLEQALQEPALVRLMLSGVDLRTAYEVLHGQERFSQTLEQVARQMETAMAKKFAEAQGRPTENGMGGNSAAVVKQDVSQMTRNDRADIIRRVRKGETIRF